MNVGEGIKRPHEEETGEPLVWVPVRERKQRALRARLGGLGGDEEDIEEEEKKKDEERRKALAERSLFDANVEKRVQAGSSVEELTAGGGQQAEAAARQREEAAAAEELRKAMAQYTPLKSVRERALDVQYAEGLRTDWVAPRHVREMSREAADAIRRTWHIEASGEDVPPPVTRFADLKLPPPVEAVLARKQIVLPTPIQMQGLPAALAGRDVLGVAFTGSGKTLVFVLPLVMRALGEEARLPLLGGEGPLGLLLCPSRELAQQTASVAQEFCDALAAAGHARLHVACCIGGVRLGDQCRALRPRGAGVHGIVATPGRLVDLLRRGIVSLALCRLVVLDEVDVLIDRGFEDDVRAVMDHFGAQRQTLLFSATMPLKIQQFARSALVRPVEIRVGRAGAANLDVIQEVEYVKQDAKIVYLLDCLQKTPPPVLVFCENKADVDDIHEYLLLKGVDAAAVHGGMDQAERSRAVADFKRGTKDVLVATDVASKGLDFPNINHVINFDCPAEIDTYVHRIGRTGRCGKTGVATTFINKSVPETVLLDLKQLLLEAHQRVPNFLLYLQPPGGDVGGSSGGGASSTSEECPYCGGLGHRLTDCPKYAADQRARAKASRDFTFGSERSGGVGDY